jgi:hypothetical protein
MEIGIVLTIVFVALKLTHVIDWSWIWVFSPLWIGAAIMGIFFAITGATSFFFSRRERRRWEEREDNVVEARATHAEATEPERTGKVTAGGVLTIIAGALGLVGGILLLTVGTILPMEEISPASDAFIGLGVIVLVVWGVLPLISGILALKRRKWGFALAGAILVCYPLFFLGIPAVILIAIGRKEFSRAKLGHSLHELPISTSESDYANRVITITCGACYTKFQVGMGQGTIRVKCPNCQRESQITT